jgi:hypothetical protein
MSRRAAIMICYVPLMKSANSNGEAQTYSNDFGEQVHKKSINRERLMQNSLKNISIKKWRGIEF